MSIQPLHDHILVERVEAENKTKGGIIIPDNAQEKPMEGKIISVGEGSRDASGNRIALDVKIGDRVLFKKWGGDEIKYDGKELLIMKEDNILAIIK